MRRLIIFSLVFAVSTGVALAQPCPGDLNGDRHVSVNELITSVGSSLNGCPGTQPTATQRRATPTPTPIQARCPYEFQHAADPDLGPFCDYIGPWNQNCNGAQFASWASTGSLVVVAIPTSTANIVVLLGGSVIGPGQASLEQWSIDGFQTSAPLSGAITLTQDGHLRVNVPNAAFWLGSEACPFSAYNGTYNGLLHLDGTVTPALRLQADEREGAASVATIIPLGAFDRLQATLSAGSNPSSPLPGFQPR